MLKALHRDPDPSWNNLQDPDPNTMDMDPQHWFKCLPMKKNPASASSDGLGEVHLQIILFFARAGHTRQLSRQSDTV